MRLKVPITGTVLDFDPEAAKLDGIGISGQPGDPVRIDLDLGNVSWRLVSIDLVNDLAEIEVTPGESIGELKPGGVPTNREDWISPTNREDWISRPVTPAEKQGFLDDARSRVAAHTVDPAKKLVKSASVVKKYTDFQMRGR